MRQKLIKLEKKIILEIYPSHFDPDKKIYYWGIRNPKYIDEIKIKTFKKDNSKDQFQIQINWSKRGIFELGKYLIALSEFDSHDPDYHDHFDRMDWLNWNSEIIFRTENN